MKRTVKASRYSRYVDDFDVVEYLGAYLKPHRRYIFRQSLPRITKKRPIVLQSRNPCLLNSYLGILSHFSAYHLTKHLFYQIHGNGGYFTKWMKKWVEYPR